MIVRRISIGLVIAFAAVLTLAMPALAETISPGNSNDQPHLFAAAQPVGTITVTAPSGGASYAAYPTGRYSFPDRVGTFAPALFEESATPVTVNWQAIDVAGDVAVAIVMDGEAIHTATVAASAGSYTWVPAVEFGRSYDTYASCQATVTSLLDAALADTSATFAIVPWGTVVQEWNGLQVYSNFPRPNWIAPGVSSIPVFGDSGFGFRYQCVELAQRWTTQTQHWQDRNGNALPDHWAGSSAKEVLQIAKDAYGLPTVSNDHMATAPPDVGDLLVWGSGQYGHVAVVGPVEGDHIRVYEENGANLEGTRTLALGRSSGKVWVDQEGVIGWIKPLQRYSFTDIDSSPYKQAIESIAQAGIISGFIDGTFGPEKLVIRQQFAKMIVKTLDLNVTSSEICPFVDVPEHVGSDPFYPSKYVAVCAAYDITRGKTETTFAPYDNITRQQLITMIVRAADLPEPPEDFIPPFASNQFYPDEHYLSALKAAYAGLLDGLQGVGPAYDFLEAASRGECAQLLHNLLQVQVGY